MPNRKPKILLIGGGGHYTSVIDVDMFKECQYTDLSNALWLEERVVNIPSGVILGNRD